MGTPRTSEMLRLGESSVNTSARERKHGPGDIPLYQARMGGSTGRSSSRCLEGPGVGRGGCMPANFSEMVDEEEQRNLECRSAVIYGSDICMSGSHT